MSKASQNFPLDRPHVMAWETMIRAASRFYKIPAPIIAGIMARESGGGRHLRPQGPAGTGDFGHGKGLMQIDDRWHQFARTGPWRDALANIKYGAQLLANYRTQAVKSGVPEKDALRVALAGYNCGMGNALAAYRAGGIANVDARTTGKDYSKDVLERASLFAPLFPLEKKTFLTVLLGVLAALMIR